MAILTLNVWIDDSDAEMIENDHGLDEQAAMDALSEAITEWAGKEWGIVLNAETEG